MTLLKRSFLLTLLLLCASFGARATDITVSSFNTAGVYQQADTVVTLRLYYSETFVDNLGNVIVGGGGVDSPNFFKSIACSLNSSTKVVTCPSFAMPSTINSSNALVTVTGVLYGGRTATALTKRSVIFSNWKVPATPTTTTYADLNTYNLARRPTNPETYYTTAQIDARLAALTSSAQKASDSLYGVGKTSVPPASSTNPIFAGSNDPAIPASLVSVTGYPYYADSTGVADATSAIQSALDSSPAGGTVWLPKGNYRTTATLLVPEYVTLKGTGIQATRIVYSGTSYAVKFNGTVGSYLHGQALRDLEILQTNSSGQGIYVLGAHSYQIENVYVEGVPSGNNRCLTVESSIYGNGDFVNCAHNKYGYKLTGGAPNQSTTFSCRNCHYGQASVQAGSVALEVNADSGESVWTSGNFEYVDTAIYLNGGHGMLFIGQRFEGVGTWQINISTFAYGNKFIGSYGLVAAKINNAAGAGFNSNDFTSGSIDSPSATPYPNLMVGTLNLAAFQASDRVLQISGASGQSEDLVRVDDSSNTNHFLRVDSSGKTIIGNTGSGISLYKSATATWDPSNLANGATVTTAVTVSGAAVGDTVTVGFASITSGGWQISGQVTSSNTVTVTLTNQTGGGVDLPSGTLRVAVFQH